MYSSRFVPYRTFKNFGHKREPVPRFTLIWHGFLTFSFIGLGLEWKRMARFFFGEDGDSMISPMDAIDDQKKKSERTSQ